MTLSPPLLALVSAVTILPVWTEEKAWRYDRMCRSLILAAGILDLYAVCLAIVRVVAVDWPPSIGLARVAPLEP